MFFSPGTAWGFDDEDIHKGENSLRVPEVDDQGLPITRHTTQLYYTTPPKSVSQIQTFITLSLLSVAHLQGEITMKSFIFIYIVVHAICI